MTLTLTPKLTLLVSVRMFLDLVDTPQNCYFGTYFLGYHLWKGWELRYHMGTVLTRRREGLIQQLKFYMSEYKERDRPLT